MAGLVGAIVVLPQGVDFAAVAGILPEYGLYADMVPAIIAGLFASSRHLVSGPTTARFHRHVFCVKRNRTARLRGLYSLGLNTPVLNRWRQELNTE